MKASAVLDRARDLLQDTGADRWGDTALLRYLDDAQVVLAEHRPAAIYKREAVQLSQGAAQDIPTDGVRLLAGRRYMGTDGTTGGDPVTEVDVETMDRRAPGWRTDRQKDKPRHIVLDAKARDHYEVYPPNTGNGYLEIDYSYAPVALSADTDDLAVDEQWRPALVDYVVYRALQEDDEFAGGETAAMHYKTFWQVIGNG